MGGEAAGTASSSAAPAETGRRTRGCDRRFHRGERQDRPRPIDANAGLGGNQAFNYIGAGGVLRHGRRAALRRQAADAATSTATATPTSPSGSSDVDEPRRHRHPALTVSRRRSAGGALVSGAPSARSLNADDPALTLLFRLPARRRGRRCAASGSPFPGPVLGMGLLVAGLLAARAHRRRPRRGRRHHPAEPVAALRAGGGRRGAAGGADRRQLAGDPGGACRLDGADPGGDRLTFRAVARLRARAAMNGRPGPPGRSGSISRETPLLWLTATLVAYVIGDWLSARAAGTRSPTRW